MAAGWDELLERRELFFFIPRSILFIFFVVFVSFCHFPPFSFIVSFHSSLSHFRFLYLYLLYPLVLDCIGSVRIPQEPLPVRKGCRNECRTNSVLIEPRHCELNRRLRGMFPTRASECIVPRPHLPSHWPQSIQAVLHDPSWSCGGILGTCLQKGARERQP